MNENVFFRNEEKEWFIIAQTNRARFNFHVILNNEFIFIFGGESMNKNFDLTNIEIFDLRYYIFTTVKTFKFPFEIRNTEMCWHGDDILLLGGQDHKGKPLNKVLSFGIKNKEILSLRDMKYRGKFGSFAAFKSDFDELTSIGVENGELYCEKRSWDFDLLDYTWKDNAKIKFPYEMFQEAKSGEFNLRVIKPTFSCYVKKKDKFPKFTTDSNYLFGSDEYPFIIEITERLSVRVHPAPLQLPLKKKQLCFRYDHNSIYFFGGVESSTNKCSMKGYMLDIQDRCVIEMNDMIMGRCEFAYARLGFFLFITGGITFGESGEKIVLSITEKFSFKKESWELLNDIKVARYGHFMWADYKTKKIYLAGGYSKTGDILSSIEILDPETNIWTLCEENLPCPIAEAKIVGPFENKFYCILGGISGSQDRPEYRDSVMKFYKESVWDMKEIKKMSTPRVGCKVFTEWRGNNLFVFGGTEEPVFEIYKGKKFEDVKNKFIGKMVNNFYAQLCNHTSKIDLVEFSSG